MKQRIKKLSIIVPVHNEEKTLQKILKKVENVKLEGVEKEIVIVEDGSSDSTPQILKTYQKKKLYQVFFNKKNLGKTRTVKRGLLKSTGDVVVVQDGDLEYNPEDLKELLKHFQNNTADVVYGNRFGKKLKDGGPNYYGNLAVTFISNLFTTWRGFRVPDMETCYKMVRGDAMRDIAKTIRSRSMFGLEPELTAKLSKYKLNGKRLRLKTVDIHYYPRTSAEGKHMKALRDGLKALWEIIRYNLFP